MTIAHTSIDALLLDLERNRPWRMPRIRGFVFAAVAIAVAPDGDDLRLVLIGRAARKDDRWSGDIAFPGGLASDEDASGVATARREATEEIGLELDAPIGSLSDRITFAPGRAVPMRLRPFLFRIGGTETLVPNPREVAAIYRPTLREIESAPRIEIERRLGPLRHRFAGRAIGEHHLWGLTASLVDELRARMERGRSSIR